MSRSGLIQARLRAIHRNVKNTGENLKFTRKRATTSTTGGPKPKVLFNPETDEIPQNVDDLILQLNGTCSKSGTDEIKRLMQETFPHRKQLRTNSDPSILKQYPKFTECNFLVS